MKQHQLEILLAYVVYHVVKMCKIFNRVVFLDLPGTLVPSATTEMAVTASFNPTVQPNSVARSCINRVSTPIIIILTVKHSQPPR